MTTKEARQERKKLSRAFELIRSHGDDIQNMIIELNEIEEEATEAGEIDPPQFVAA